MGFASFSIYFVLIDQILGCKENYFFHHTPSFIFTEVKVLTAVNASVESGNVEEMMVSLQHPALQLDVVCTDDSLHYYQLLKVRECFV